MFFSFRRGNWLWRFSRKGLLSFKKNGMTWNILEWKEKNVNTKIHRFLDSCCRFVPADSCVFKKPGPVRCWWALCRLRAAGLFFNFPLDFYRCPLSFWVRVSTHTNVSLEILVHTTILEFPRVKKKIEVCIRNRLMVIGHRPNQGRHSRSVEECYYQRDDQFPPFRRRLTMVHNISIHIYISYVCSTLQMIHNLPATWRPSPFHRFFIHQASRFQNFSDLVVVIGGCSRNQARSAKMQNTYVSSE